MNILYKQINIILVIISLYSACLGMKHTAIISINFSHLPEEIHKTIFNALDLRSQDKLRATSLYWKKIGDHHTTNPGLVRLLHSLPDSTKQANTRILFYAIYNNDYALTKYILERTPNQRLYLDPIRSSHRLDPYRVAQGNNDEAMINLLKQYHYDEPNYGFDKYNQKITCSAEWPQPLILRELLIACISGDDTFLKEIINIKFKQDNILDTIRRDNIEKQNGDEPDKQGFTADASIMIKKAFYIITHNDDEKCIVSFIQFIKDYPKCDFFLGVLLEEACRQESKKVFVELVKHKADIDINKKRVWIWNIDNKKQVKKTFKDEILDRDLTQPMGKKSQKYYNEIENILNEYGAKTVAELHLAESPYMHNNNFLLEKAYSYWHNLFDQIKLILRSFYRLLAYLATCVRL